MTYTTTQAAERLGLDPSHVRRLAGSLGIGTKFGRDWMFSDDDLTALEQRQKPPNPDKSAPTPHTTQKNPSNC